MTELRDKIASALAENLFGERLSAGRSYYLQEADKILAIPEIAFALSMVEAANRWNEEVQ